MNIYIYVSTTCAIIHEKKIEVCNLLQAKGLRANTWRNEGIVKSICIPFIFCAAYGS